MSTSASTHRRTATPDQVSRTAMTMGAVGIIWKREMLRWWRDKPRIIGSTAFPLIFLLVFGSGLSGAMGNMLGGGAAAVDFEQFIFPGIIAMSVFFTALFNAVSLVYDREFGILKEVLVAPVSRAAVALGKTLGGATVATLQGTVIFVFAPFVGIRLTPLLVLQLWPIMFIGAFALSSMGIAIAARMRSIESFQMVNQFVMFPLIFLSGIFFPLQGLPVWMNVLVRINPVSYAVDPLRRLILEAQGLPDELLAQLSESGLALSVGGRQVGVVAGIAIVAGFGIVMNVLAMWLISIRD
ncbi:MAG TPA: ABC transporter permease [Euzebyales bacterium]